MGHCPEAAITKHPIRGLKQQPSTLPSPGDLVSEVKGSQGCPPSRGSRGGSFLPLPASGGSRRPWAGGHLPPVSASVFPWLLLCVCVSSCVSQEDTVPGWRPPSSRRTSSQIPLFITPAQTPCPNCFLIFLTHLKVISRVIFFVKLFAVLF